MPKKPINQVLAEALAFFMGRRFNYSTLGAKAGVAPNTVKNYLNPEGRAASASGKAPSAKLTELEKLATALGLEVVDLLSDLSPQERLTLYRQRAAAYYVEHGRMPDWEPTEDWNADAAAAGTVKSKPTGTHG